MSAARQFATRLGAWRPEISVERLTVLTCIYLSLVANGAFWQAAFGGHAIDAPATWRMVFGTFIALSALHVAALIVFANRWTVKPLLAGIVIASAMAAYYMDHYAVFMDPDMLRNILHTEYKEARELVTPGLVTHIVLMSALPLLMLWRVRILRRSLPRAAIMRVLAMIAAVSVAAGGLAIAYRDLSALMRNQKEVRYLVTPGNFLYAAMRVVASDARQAQQAIAPIGLDAQVGPRPPESKPRLLVIVVGETVRAQNWGLNGYARDTTPQLRALDVINFSNVRACGTATEVSLPCMFSAVGRRDYDEERIRGQESLLHVLTHGGLTTLWRDNQTGCKGVCAGLPFQQLNAEEVAGLCKDGLCLDEILLHGLQRDIDAAKGDLVVVLHPLGNHGPSYHLRYPERFRKYTPTCDSAELGDCSKEEVGNSYDNAVLYGDHFVAETIRLLAAQTGRDSALIYLSDHGESLGEHGLYLHGVPYAIAPEQQTAVPMVTWLSPSFAASARLDTACLRAKAAAPLAHDHLFHSTLGLLDVETSVYAPEFDLFRSCRAPAPT